MDMHHLHSLLRRQIKRHLEEIDTIPAEWEGFFTAVNEAYRQYDADYSTLERSLELSSHELQTANTKMRAVYERLINSSIDGIFAFDRECRFIVWNPGMEKQFGVSKLQTLGKYAFDVFPVLLKMGEDRYFQSALAGQTITVNDRSFSLTDGRSASTANGEQRFFESQYAPLLNESGAIIGGLGIIHDSTKRKQAEEEQHRQSNYLIALQEMALRLNSRMELADLLEDILARTEVLLGTSHVFIAMSDADNAMLVMRHCSGLFGPMKDRQFACDSGELGTIWSTREPLIVDNHDEQSQFISTGTGPGGAITASGPPEGPVPTPPSEEIDTWMGIPLFKGTQVAGIIGVAHTVKGNIFQDGEIALLKQFAQLISIALNQEALHEANERLAAMAHTDPLTGLPNHRTLMGNIDNELSHCRQTGNTCAILFVDLDHFKHINDTWGHRAGDAILREAARRLAANVRHGDFVGRYGGEEFAIVLAQTDLPAARMRAEQIRLALAEQPCFFTSEDDSQTVITIPITASIGVAIFDQYDATRELLVQAADSAMYHAKRSGRNRVCVAGEVESQTYHIAADETTGEAMTLRALVAAANEYDHDTAEHAQRMIWLAVMTAHKLECSPDEVELIRLAAVLHDIGKIGVPHETLRKPGPLTPDEWTVMRRHPDIGRQILQKVGGRFEAVSHIVVSHHERWNGEGYPYGLQRDAIPIGARILAVADSYDAMTSRRAYREPMADDAARAELLRCAGQQFDPQVVMAFLTVLDEQEAQRAA